MRSKTKMLEKPNLTDDRIIACVQDSYDIAIANLEFLPLGNDTFARVYRAGTAEGVFYFLKLRKGPVYEPSLTVPRALQNAGVSQVVAPLPTATAENAWATIDDYTVILYPFIHGRNAVDLGLTDPQWVDFGAILKQIHSAVLPDGVLGLVPRETFVSSWCNGVRELQGTIERTKHNDPHAREQAAIWQNNRAEIARIVARTDELGRALRTRPPELVLCHTDPHPANLLVDRQGRLHVVDWDAPLLAPKERDLHFVIDSVASPLRIGRREEDLIFQGYGPTTIDWLALTYFRYEWVCGDLFGYAERACFVEDVGDVAKAGAVRRTRAMFEPGNSVASAFDLERRAMREGGL